MNLLTKATTATLLSLTLLTMSVQAKESTTQTTGPLITYVSQQDATGDIKAVYDEIQAAFGIVPEPIKAYSLNPKLLRSIWEMYKVSMENTNFSPKLGAMMRMLVAESKQCEFCVGFNKGMLMNMLKVPEAEILALQKDPTTANLPEQEKAMLLFMLKTTKDPHGVTKADIDALKKLGWSEKDIMEGANDATHMVAASLFIDTFKIQ